MWQDVLRNLKLAFLWLLPKMWYLIRILLVVVCLTTVWLLTNTYHLIGWWLNSLDFQSKPKANNFQNSEQSTSQCLFPEGSRKRSVSVSSAQSDTTLGGSTPCANESVSSTSYERKQTYDVSPGLFSPVPKTQFEHPFAAESTGIVDSFSVQNNEQNNSSYYTPPMPQTSTPYSNISRATNRVHFQDSNNSIYQTPPCGPQNHLSQNTQTREQGLNPCHSFADTSSKSWCSPRRSRKPDHYDGATDWSDYINHFEAVAAWNGWCNEEKAVQLTMSLTSTARQTWSDCFADKEQCWDYNVLVDTLKTRFKPEGQEEAFKAEFRGRHKQKSESFMEFGHALRRLGIRAFPKLNHEAREDLIRDQFLLGLVDPEMRKHVSLAHPKNIDQAITMATEYDVVNQSTKPKPPLKPQVVAAVQPASSTNSLDVLSTLVEKLDKLLERRSKPGCWKCGKFGHRHFQCRSTEKDVASMQEGQKSPEKSVSPKQTEQSSNSAELN